MKPIQQQLKVLSSTMLFFFNTKIPNKSWQQKSVLSITVWLINDKMSMPQENLSLGFPTSQSHQLQRLHVARKLKFRLWQVQIRYLPICNLKDADKTAWLACPFPKDRFSHVEAQMVINSNQFFPFFQQCIYASLVKIHPPVQKTTHGNHI